MSGEADAKYAAGSVDDGIKEPPTKRARISRSPEIVHPHPAAALTETSFGLQPPASSLSAPTSSAQAVADSFLLASLSSSGEAASCGPKEMSSSDSNAQKSPRPEPDAPNPAPDDPPSSDFDDLDWGWLEKGEELEKSSSPSKAHTSRSNLSSKGKAKATHTPSNAALPPITPARPVEVPKQVFFQTASHKKVAISERALREAQRRLEAWEAEEKELQNDPKLGQLHSASASSSTDTDQGIHVTPLKVGAASSSKSLQRPGLESELKAHSFTTPRPSRFRPPRPSLQHASTAETPLPTRVKRELIPTPSTTIVSARELRQPLTTIEDPAQTSRTNKLLDTAASDLHTPAKASKLDQNSSPRPLLSTGLRRGPAAATAATRARGRFSTPFKKVRPDTALASGERNTLTSPSKLAVPSFDQDEASSVPTKRRIHALPAPMSAPQRLLPQSDKAEATSSADRRFPPVFDLTPLSRPRLGLREAGFKPETTSIAYATSFGVPSEVFVILRHPDLSRHYVFEAPKDIVVRGCLSPVTALSALRDAVVKANAEAGRTCGVGSSAMAAISEECLSLRWVQNHWGLVLWKLAAYVRHKPERVFELWSWSEVMRQLRYRYEREVNHAARSALKRIQEHDASSSGPMVLVVRGIMDGAPHWTQAIDDGSNLNDAARGGSGESAPYTLELSDGWYRVRASVDKTLGRAIARGRLKQGHKLAIRGARLHSAQDGTHVLDALDKYGLSLTGNSTALARWDTPLGFSSVNFCASVRSLTADGGCIACMDVVIAKVHPRGFIDVNGRESGQHQSLSNARSEAEELEAETRWQIALEEARASVQADMEARAERWEEIKELVEEWGERLGSSSQEGLSRGDALEACERLLNELLSESNPRQVLKTAAEQRTLLSQVIERLRNLVQERIQEEQADVAYEAQRRIQELCPPRRTRSFQVVRIRDAISPAISSEADTANGAGPASDKLRRCKRTAQLTVWDAAELARGEGADGEDVSGTSSIGGGLVEGGRYLVTQLQPMSRDRWRNAGADAEVDIYLCTRRNTTWRRIS
ncbi:hypothetical protein OC846_004205 [Tilletia horrida]|uniref:BRCA2 OB1 domain-containing protein n=1 Tax=Tilletia horrida TaxID=155126 RepID=A0AAN6GN14_9BASI|nr:hypothetical protein OC846_004205 [Tilletia horrida]